MFTKEQTIRGLLIVLAGLLVTDLCAAQYVGGGAAGFQTIIADPRSRALGEATVALRGNAGALSINPATIGRPGMVQGSSNLGLEEGASSFFKTPWLPAMFNELGVVNPTWDVRRGRWAVGYQYKYLDLGEHEVRDAQNRTVDTVRSYDRSHKLAVAYNVTQHLAVGAGANLIHIKLGNQRVGSTRSDGATGVSLDLGLVYDRTFKVPYVMLNPAVGWSLTDFGPMLAFDGMDQKDPLSMMMRGGVSLQAASQATLRNRPILTVGLHGNLSKSMVGGELEDGQIRMYGPIEALVKTWKPVDVRTNSLSEAEGEYKTLSVAEQLIVHRGLELSLLEIFYLRYGRFHEDEYNGSRQYATRGWGVDLYYLAFDYSVTITDDTTLRDQSFWRLTARVPLEASPDNFWRELARLIN